MVEKQTWDSHLDFHDLWFQRLRNFRTKTHNEHKRSEKNLKMQTFEVFEVKTVEKRPLRLLNVRLGIKIFKSKNVKKISRYLLRPRLIGVW